MELKSYQQKVIENLEEYLTYVQEQKDLKTAFVDSTQDHFRDELLDHIEKVA